MVGNISVLGYLMDLLNISINDLSIYLNLERSTVSKWKNGTRKLSSTSFYYNWIIEYLIAENSNSGNKTLETLFLDIFLNEDDSNPKYLYKCINMFLTGNYIPKSADINAEHSKNFLYNTHISVFKGINGRLNAIDTLTDILKKLNTTTELFISDCDNFFITSKDKQSKDIFFKLLFKFLNTGHKITVIHYISADNPMLDILFKDYSYILFHENFENYCFVANDQHVNHHTYYTIKDTASLIGYFPNKKSSNLYSAIYYDSFTISQHQETINSIIKISTPMFLNTGNKPLDLLEAIILRNLYKNEPTLLYSNYLGLATMGTELLNQLLLKLSIPDADKQRTIQIHKAIALNNLDNANLCQHVYIIEDIQNFYNEEDSIFYITFNNKPYAISITKKEKKQHILDTIQYLKELSNFKVALLHKDSSLSISSSIITVCKNNLWYYNLDFSTGNMRFNENSQIANIICSTIKKSCYSTSFELQNKEAVIQRLSEIINSPKESN